MAKHMLRVVDWSSRTRLPRIIELKCDKCRKGFITINREDLGLMLLIKGYVPSFNPAYETQLRAWGKCREDAHAS